MELKEFVKTSLLEIVEGVKEAQQVLESGDGSPAAINPMMHIMHSPTSKNDRVEVYGSPGHSVQNVEFDVAVSSSESTDANLGGKITIVIADIGADKSRTRQNQVANRLRFTVPVALSTSTMLEAKS